jgi:acetolactate synthase I/III small subunit
MLTFIVHVRRTPEVLARVVLLFHRRRIQIDSLAAGHAEQSGVQRIEVTVEEEQAEARLIEANLCKLVDVLLVEKSNRDKEIGHFVTKDGHCES